MTHVGVAFEVPEPFGSYLHERREFFGDPSARLMPPHVTLLPPRVVSDAFSDDVVAHLAVAAGAAVPFEVRLSGAATFRPVTPTVYLPLELGVSECEQLAEQVRSGPLATRLAFPYHPHVTVGMDLPNEELDAIMADLVDFSAGFTVESLTLYEPTADGSWRPVQSFPFGVTSGAA